MKKYIKKSKIGNLLVLPLIASAIFLASPVFAAGGNVASNVEIRNVTSQEGAPNTKKGVLGTVTSINGEMLVITTKDEAQFNVNAASATIMTAGEAEDSNPNLISIKHIKVGDAIFVRGKINYDTE